MGNHALTRRTTNTLLWRLLILIAISVIGWKVLNPAENGSEANIDTTTQIRDGLALQLPVELDFRVSRSVNLDVRTDLSAPKSALTDHIVRSKYDYDVESGEVLREFHAALWAGHVDQIDRIWKRVLQCEACLVRLSDDIAYGGLDPILEAEIAARLIRDNVPRGVYAVVNALDVSIEQQELARIDNLMTALQGMEGMVGAKALIDAVARGTPYFAADSMLDDLLHVVAKTLAHVPESTRVGEIIADEMTSADFETRDRLEVLAKQNAAAIVQLSSTDEYFMALLDESMNNVSPASALGSLAAKAENITLVGALDSAISNNELTEEELIEFSVEVGLGIKDQETVDAFVVYLNEAQLAHDQSLKSQMTAIALTRIDSPEAEAAIERYLEVALIENPGDAELVQSFRE